MKNYYVYITASNSKKIYVGVTGNLIYRIARHKEGMGSKHTRKYNKNRLVYFEEFNDINQAIYREKQLKKWNRAWKIQLIEKINPQRDDLSYNLL